MDPFETRLRETIAELSYKDWQFRVGKDGIGLWFLQVVATSFDVLTDEPLRWSGRKWRMSMHMTKSEIVQTALKAVLAAEEHEAREHFMFRGRAIFGPHLSIEGLWLLAPNQDRRQPA
jgi:hypothetical protein